MAYSGFEVVTRSSYDGGVLDGFEDGFERSSSTYPLTSSVALTGVYGKKKKKYETAGLLFLYLSLKNRANLINKQRQTRQR
jgi:hypothetical protein